MFTLSDRPEYRAPIEPASDAARRIVGIMPFLTGKARRWLRRQPARVRAGFDVEDVLQELWIELLAKDRHFDPTRASYTTFAAIVVDRMLQRLGDRLCRGPRPSPLECDMSDAHAETPVESIERAEASQRAVTAVADALRRLDDRHHFVIVASYGIGLESMTVAQLSAWFVTSPSAIIQARARAKQELRVMLAG